MAQSLHKMVMSHVQLQHTLQLDWAAGTYWVSVASWTDDHNTSRHSLHQALCRHQTYRNKCSLASFEYIAWIHIDIHIIFIEITFGCSGKFLKSINAEAYLSIWFSFLGNLPNLCQKTVHIHDCTTLNSFSIVLQLYKTKDTIFDSRGGVEGQEFLKKTWNPLLYTWATWFLPILRLGCVKKSNFLRYQNFATFFTCHFCFGFCSPRLSFFNKYAKYAPF